jgi:hypothetical protein
MNSVIRSTMTYRWNHMASWLVLVEKYGQGATMVALQSDCVDGDILGELTHDLASKLDRNAMTLNILIGDPNSDWVYNNLMIFYLDA